MLESVYQYITCFVEISLEEFSIISDLLQTRHFEKKVRLVGIGEQEQYINFVLKGLIRKFFYRNKEEVITQIAKEKDLICSPPDKRILPDGVAGWYPLKIQKKMRKFLVAPKLQRRGYL